MCHRSLHDTPENATRARLEVKMLHPTYQAVIAERLKANYPKLADAGISSARELFSAGTSLLGTGPQEVSVSARQIHTRSGGVGARLYCPPGRINGLGLYVHGGGWVLGTLDDYDCLVRTLALRSKCAFLAPDYRLAPEHPFPCGLNDIEDATIWAWKNRSMLVGEDTPFITVGDSAGANLASVAAVKVAYQIAISRQFLLYPVTDCEQESQSYREFGNDYLLTKTDMQWFFEQYAGATPQSDLSISPLRMDATSLARMPSTWVGTAEYDVLRDQGEAFALRLQEVGVPTALRRFQGLPHGFARWTNVVDAADRAISEVAQSILAACH